MSSDYQPPCLDIACSESEDNIMLSVKESFDVLSLVEIDTVQPPCMNASKVEEYKQQEDLMERLRSMAETSPTNYIAMLKQTEKLDKQLSDILHQRTPMTTEKRDHEEVSDFAAEEGTREPEDSTPDAAFLALLGRGETVVEAAEKPSTVTVVDTTGKIEVFSKQEKKTVEGGIPVVEQTQPSPKEDAAADAESFGRAEVVAPSTSLESGSRPPVNSNLSGISHHSVRSEKSNASSKKSVVSFLSFSSKKSAKKSLAPSPSLAEAAPPPSLESSSHLPVHSIISHPSTASSKESANKYLAPSPSLAEVAPPPSLESKSPPPVHSEKSAATASSKKSAASSSRTSAELCVNTTKSIENGVWANPIVSPAAPTVFGPPRRLVRSNGYSPAVSEKSEGSKPGDAFLANTKSTEERKLEALSTLSSSHAESKSKSVTLESASTLSTNEPKPSSHPGTASADNKEESSVEQDQLSKQNSDADQSQEVDQDGIVKPVAVELPVETEPMPDVKEKSKEKSKSRKGNKKGKFFGTKLFFAKKNVSDAAEPPRKSPVLEEALPIADKESIAELISTSGDETTAAVEVEVPSIVAKSMEVETNGESTTVAVPTIGTEAVIDETTSQQAIIAAEPKTGPKMEEDSGISISAKSMEADITEKSSGVSTSALSMEVLTSKSTDKEVDVEKVGGMGKLAKMVDSPKGKLASPKRSVSFFGMASRAKIAKGSVKNPIKEESVAKPSKKLPMQLASATPQTDQKTVETIDQIVLVDHRSSRKIEIIGKASPRNIAKGRVEEELFKEESAVKPSKKLSMQLASPAPKTDQKTEETSAPIILLDHRSSRKVEIVGKWTDHAMLAPPPPPAEPCIKFKKTTKKPTVESNGETEGKVVLLDSDRELNLPGDNEDMHGIPLDSARELNMPGDMDGPQTTHDALKDGDPKRAGRIHSTITRLASKRFGRSAKTSPRHNPAHVVKKGVSPQHNPVHVEKKGVSPLQVLNRDILPLRPKEEVVEKKELPQAASAVLPMPPKAKVCVEEVQEGAFIGDNASLRVATTERPESLSQPTNDTTHALINSWKASIDEWCSPRENACIMSPKTGVEEKQQGVTEQAKTVEEKQQGVTEQAKTPQASSSPSWSLVEWCTPRADTATEALSPDIAAKEDAMSPKANIEKLEQDGDTEEEVKPSLSSKSAGLGTEHYPRVASAANAGTDENLVTEIVLGNKKVKSKRISGMAGRFKRSLHLPFRASKKQSSSPVEELCLSPRAKACLEEAENEIQPPSSGLSAAETARRTLRTLGLSENPHHTPLFTSSEEEGFFEVVSAVSDEEPAAIGIGNMALLKSKRDQAEWEARRKRIAMLVSDDPDDPATLTPSIAAGQSGSDEAVKMQREAQKPCSAEGKPPLDRKSKQEKRELTAGGASQARTKDGISPNASVQDNTFDDDLSGVFSPGRKQGGKWFW